MPENFCPDRFKPIDPIDQEANNISRLLQNGNRMEASARLQADIQSMGPTKFMTLVGETRALANLNNSMTNVEVTTVNNGQVRVSLVTEDRLGRQISLPEPVVQIENNEGFILLRPARYEPVPPPTVPCEPPRSVPCEPPRSVPCEPPRPVPCEPPRPPVLCEPPPLRIPPTWERPCPPQGGSGWNLQLDFNLKDIFGHIGVGDNRGSVPRFEPHYPPQCEPRFQPPVRYQPPVHYQPPIHYQPPVHYEPTSYGQRSYDPRGQHSNSNRGDGSVIVNNYVNVQGGDSRTSSASSTSPSETRRQDSQRQDLHRQDSQRQDSQRQDSHRQDSRRQDSQRQDSHREDSHSRAEKRR